MTLLTIKLKAIQAALVEVLPATFHYWRPINNDRTPFIVWAENGENSRLDVNNFKDLQAIGGNIDFYTKKEFDPLVDDIQSRLQGLQLKMPFGWVLDTVQYEDSTGLIHYSWAFEV